MVLGGMCIGLCMAMSRRVWVIYGAGWNVYRAVYGYVAEGMGYLWCWVECV